MELCSAYTIALAACWIAVGDDVRRPSSGPGVATFWLLGLFTRSCRLLFRIDLAALSRAILFPNGLPFNLIPIDTLSDENTDAGTGFEAQRRRLRTNIRRWRSGQKLHPSLHDLSITVRFAASILGGEGGREKKRGRKNYIPDCATPSSKPFFPLLCIYYYSCFRL